MKFLLPSLAVATLLAAPLATAGLVIQETLEQTGPMPMNSEMTISVEGDVVRVDIGEDLSTIVDSKSGEVISLMHGQKIAMQMPKGALDVMKSKAAGDRSAEKPKLEPTGKKEEINGFACEEYAGTYEGMQVSYWTTRDIRNEKEILEQLEKLSGEADPFKGALQGDEEFPGIPIRTIVESPQTGKSTMTITSIEEKSVPATEFEVPSDYKTMQMPQMSDPGMGAPAMPVPATGN